MDFSQRYEICRPGVIAENFDGEIVILNLEDGLYFSLRGSGPSIWNALMAGATPASILEDARSNGPHLVESIDRFVQRLAELHLIRSAVGDTIFLGTPGIEWSTVLSADQPEIEVFDDLSELIMADPIHDVDADAGWPMRKAA